MTTKRTSTAVTAAALGALLLTGCATDTDSTPEPAVTSINDSGTSSQTQDSGDRYVNAEAATTDESEGIAA